MTRGLKVDPTSETFDINCCNSDMPREPSAKCKRARSGERTSSPGQHLLATDKEACAPNLQRPYFSSSVIRPNKLCSSSAIPAVK
jgi:hypothetical protein